MCVPVSVSVCLCEYMIYNCGCPWRPGRVSDTLELELQMVMSLLVWVLGTHPRSPVRAASTLNHLVIFPAPFLIILRILSYLKKIKSFFPSYIEYVLTEKNVSYKQKHFQNCNLSLLSKTQRNSVIERSILICILCI